MRWGDAFYLGGEKVSYDIFMAQGERVVGWKEGISTPKNEHPESVSESGSVATSAVG